MCGRAAVEDLYPRTVRFAEETPDRYALTVSTVQRLTLSCDTLLGICFITISLSCDLLACHPLLSACCRLQDYYNAKTARRIGFEGRAQTDGCLWRNDAARAVPTRTRTAAFE